MKKLLSLVLAAAMLLSLVPAAFAEEAETKSINGKDYGVGPRQFVLFEPSATPHAVGITDDPLRHTSIRELVIRIR